MKMRQTQGARKTVRQTGRQTRKQTEIKTIKGKKRRRKT